MGKAHKDARTFLHRWEPDLASLPVAVFGMGPGTTSPHELESSRRQLDKALVAVPLVDPFAITVFGGVVDPGKLPFPLSRMTATDARDWSAINAWADRVAERIAIGMPLAAA
jgi:menaquinone-dependent protoporphyrinogen IX oxidase